MKDKGFTLIELLVVMTIIAVLAGLALVSYQGARKSARDGKRKADLEQIRSALEMCYSDANIYPDFGFGGPISCDGETYLNVAPDDPLAPKQHYTYSGGGGTDYTLCATLETESELYCVASP